jgi:hypothetical protein
MAWEKPAKNGPESGSSGPLVKNGLQPRSPWGVEV